MLLFRLYGPHNCNKTQQSKTKTKTAQDLSINNLLQYYFPTPKVPTNRKNYSCADLGEHCLNSVQPLTLAEGFNDNGKPCSGRPRDAFQQDSYLV